MFLCFSFISQSGNWMSQKMRGLLPVQLGLKNGAAGGGVRSLTGAFLSRCSWGLVQPGVLSVPELCHHVAEAWVSATVLASCLLKYKQENPGKVKIRRWL